MSVYRKINLDPNTSEKLPQNGLLIPSYINTKKTIEQKVFFFLTFLFCEGHCQENEKISCGFEENICKRHTFKDLSKNNTKYSKTSIAWEQLDSKWTRALGRTFCRRRYSWWIRLLQNPYHVSREIPVKTQVRCNPCGPSHCKASTQPTGVSFSLQNSLYLRSEIQSTV